MSTDKMEVSNLTIVDPETGLETNINAIPTLTMATDKTLDCEPIIGWDRPMEFNATLEVKNTKRLMDTLFKSFTVSGSIDEIVRKVFLNMPLGREVVDLDFKQNKTNKKKRINKKWAKRYGYTCKVFYVEGEFHV